MAYLAGGGLASLMSEGGLVLTVKACDFFVAAGPATKEMLAADEALGRCAWSTLTCSVMDSRRGFSGRGEPKYPSELDVFLGEICDGEFEFGLCVVDEDMTASCY